MYTYPLMVKPHPLTSASSLSESTSFFPLTVVWNFEEGSLIGEDDPDEAWICSLLLPGFGLGCI